MRDHLGRDQVMVFLRFKVKQISLLKSQGGQLLYQMDTSVHQDNMYLRQQRNENIAFALAIFIQKFYADYPKTEGS